MFVVKRIALILKSLLGLVSQHDHILFVDFEKKLQNKGQKYNFKFENFSLITLIFFLEQEYGMRVAVAKTVNCSITTQLKLQRVTLLDFLKEGLDHLNLQAIQIDRERILIKPKISN